MEVVEDDLLFADLSKRIALLIMDDDERPVAGNCPTDSFQAFSRAIHPNTQSPATYEQTWRRSDSKGTGVFIPRSTYPTRRKNKQQKSVANSSNRHPNNTNTSHHNCFNPQNRC
ncbi:hypothetical protein LguiB_026178 [Lonicera macranthoides]